MDIEKNHISDRNKKILRLFLLILPYSSALYFFSFNTADPDLWGHIKFGHDLWITGKIPEFDIYSYTASGREWINHEWFSELIMYGVYNQSGSPGLLIVKLMIGITTLFILTRIIIHRTFNPIAFSICLTLSAAIMSPGFMVRPQLITFLFAAYFLYVFHTYLEHNKNLLWSLPLIMILWVNSHGGFLIGAGLFPVVVLCEIIYCLLKRSNRRHLRSLIFWLILTEISLLINPYGFHLLSFLYESLSISRGISEWDSVRILDLSYLRFKILAILFMLSFFINKKENRYWEVSIIALAMLYAFLHQRHTPIFAIIAAPFLTEKLTVLMSKTCLYGRVNSFFSFIIVNIAVVILIGYQVLDVISKHTKTNFNIVVDPNVYPVHAVSFLKENDIKGNILLPFEWGEYVIWKLYPACKVSIDGRFRTVYPEKVLNDHFEAMRNGAKWIELLDKYPSDIFLVRRDILPQDIIANMQDWVYIYSDSLTRVFIKNGPAQREILKNLGKRELIYPEGEFSIYFP
ncbi:hypothetical protein ACFL1N_04515 [Thermodesulfobacteriota bacterium]